eukprot:364588-Chlamydomonas_euryale.AAC.4
MRHDMQAGRTAGAATGASSTQGPSPAHACAHMLPNSSHISTSTAVLTVRAASRRSASALTFPSAGSPRAASASLRAALRNGSHGAGPTALLVPSSAFGSSGCMPVATADAAATWSR